MANLGSKRAKQGCIGCVGLFAILFVIALVLPKSERVAAPPPPKQELHAPPPHTKVSINDWAWEKGGFGTVMLARFTIQNDNDFDVKNIGVECRLYGNSDTPLGTGRAVIYERLSAKSSRTFRQVNLGFVHSQASKAACEVTTVLRD